MNIEICGDGKYFVILSKEDLVNYQVNFAAMRLGEPHTKHMITDLIRIIENMGMKRHCEQVSVECAATGDLGCALLITLQGAARFRFDTCDDLLDAIRAGLGAALKDGLTPDGGGYIFTPGEELSHRYLGLLLEFAERVI